MPNIGAVLKDEITRLAKKEAKALCGPLAGAVITLRKTVTEQKKQIAALQASLAKQQKANPDKAVLAAKPEELEHARVTPNNIAKLRKKLDLSRAEMGKLIDVNPNSIFLWENGKATPRLATKAKLLALRKLGKRELKKRLADATLQTSSKAQ